MNSTFFRWTAVIALSFQFAGCGDRFSSKYTLELPQAPESWVSLLGEPHWRIEWLAVDGKKQAKDILPGKTTEIEITITWTNPVTAWPWWPDLNLIPGYFKPAGALFPFDVFGNRLNLSWEAGVDAVFYHELALAYNQNDKKIPANFDWARFRELFKTEDLNEAVRNDPWLVDWQLVAEKTISSNFDRRRIVPQTTESINIPVSASEWYGTSPFAQPLYFKNGESAVFQIYSGTNVWISSEGILRCNKNNWVFSGWQ